MIHSKPVDRIQLFKDLIQVKNQAELVEIQGLTARHVSKHLEKLKTHYKARNMIELAWILQQAGIINLDEILMLTNQTHMIKVRNNSEGLLESFCSRCGTTLE